MANAWVLFPCAEFFHWINLFLNFEEIVYIFYILFVRKVIYVLKLGQLNGY